MEHKQNDWSVSLKEKYPIVSADEWKLLDEITVPKKIKKGESFLSYGKIARYAAFVISGKFAFSIFDDEGNEKIIRFAFADDFLANCESYYQKKRFGYNNYCFGGLGDKTHKH